MDDGRIAALLEADVARCVKDGSSHDCSPYLRARGWSAKFATSAKVALVRLLLNSSSLVHGYGYLDHVEPELRRFLHGARRVAFVPFAAHDHAAYTAKVRARLAQ